MDYGLDIVSDYTIFDERENKVCIRHIVRVTSTNESQTCVVQSMVLGYKSIHQVSGSFGEVCEQVLHDGCKLLLKYLFSYRQSSFSKCFFIRLELSKFSLLFVFIRMYLTRVTRAA